MTTQSNGMIASARRQLDEGQYMHALDLAEAALASAPHDSDLLLLKADALLSLERFAEALAVGRELVADAPAIAAHWHDLCRALRGLGLVDLALRVNAYALDHVAPDFQLTRFRGDTLYDTLRYDEAIAAYQPALKQFGQAAQAWRVWYNYSTCLAEAGWGAESREADRRALRALQQLLATGSIAAENYLARLSLAQGILYFRLGKWALAEQALSQSWRDDFSGPAALWLARTFRVERKRLSTVLMLPWVMRNSWLDARRKKKAQDEMLRQRAAISPETLTEIETLIAR